MQFIRSHSNEVNNKWLYATIKAVIICSQNHKVKVNPAKEILSDDYEGKKGWQTSNFPHAAALQDLLDNLSSL